MSEASESPAREHTRHALSQVPEVLARVPAFRRRPDAHGATVLVEIEDEPSAAVVRHVHFAF